MYPFHDTASVLARKIGLKARDPGRGQLPWREVAEASM